MAAVFRTNTCIYRSSKFQYPGFSLQYVTTPAVLVHSPKCTKALTTKGLHSIAFDPPVKRFDSKNRSHATLQIVVAKGVSRSLLARFAISRIKCGFGSRCCCWLSERDFRQCIATIMVQPNKTRASSESARQLSNVALAAALDIAFREQYQWHEALSSLVGRVANAWSYWLCFAASPSRSIKLLRSRKLE
jgi:hypothetical protein